MITMPCCSLARMSLKETISPSKRMSPSYVPCGWTPESTFIKVDFPAPFSPQMAWTSPCRVGAGGREPGGPLHQGALPGAVPAADGMPLALRDGQCDVQQGEVHAICGEN